MSIVKADAYGHGSEFISRHIDKIGDSIFGVSNLDEAIKLRESGINGEILILGYTPIDQIDYINKYKIIQTVYNLDYANQLNDVAKQKNIFINCHIKIDTGMSRIGFLYSDYEKQLENIHIVYCMSNLNIQGIFTHLSSSDILDPISIAHTNSQIRNFDSLIKLLRSKNIDLGLTHCQNSMGIINFRHLKYDIVRPGIILYGLNQCYESNTDLDLKPLMTFKSVISMIKYVKKGSHLSYGSFVADKDMNVATISAGYADGYPRSLSNKGYVFINNKYTKVLGSVCMDQFIIDISDIDNINIGDEVILFGGDNQYSNIDYIASNYNLFSYELLCNINKRVDKVYIEDNKIKAIC